MSEQPEFVEPSRDMVWLACRVLERANAMHLHLRHGQLRSAADSYVNGVALIVALMETLRGEPWEAA